MQSCVCQPPARESWPRDVLRAAAPVALRPSREQRTPPADPCEKADPCLIKMWIEQEIQALDWNAPQTACYTEPGSEHRPEVMLCLLCFAYATGLFGSEVIARACWSNTLLGTICGGRAPSAQEVRSFRRRNRCILQRILANVFMQAALSQFPTDRHSVSPALEQDLHNRAAHRLDLAWQMDTDDD
jgi:hypothetical protein